MDGSTHINIYSKGNTFLGRALSNFNYDVETVDGYFASIEAYWYWLNTDHINKDEIRLLSGSTAKKFGRQLKSIDWNKDPQFKLKIYNAMLTKLLRHDKILCEFKNNKLPFRHYYEYEGKIVEPKQGQWITDMWNFLREQLCT